MAGMQNIKSAGNQYFIHLPIDIITQSQK